jgi:anion-transporting  ArsA/GET3 family ATPase
VALEGLLQQSNLLIVAGKGGVGKTVLATAMAVAARRLGRRVLHVDVEGRPHPAAADTHRTILPDEALLEWLTDHGMGGVARRLTRTGSMEVIAGATPGIRELLVLAKVKQLVRDGGPGQLLVLDAPASGHAVTLLGSGRAVATAAPTGPIRAQADEVTALLEDHDRTQVVLVTLPAQTPVAETVETAYAVEDRAAIRLGPVLVNEVLDHLELPDGAPRSIPTLTAAERHALLAAAADRRGRQREQEAQIARLAVELPLPQVLVPRLLAPRIGPPELERLADVLLGARGDR